MEVLPSKPDINTIFKRLRSIPTNKQCFDCGSMNPTWATITYGTFLCIDCSANHRHLGVHLTFIKSTNLDINWSWLQLRAMQVGGNSNATSFFRQHGCSTNDSQQKYHSRAAKLYKEKLLSQAQAACRLHGTKLNISSGHGDHVQSPTEKVVDFFDQHVNEHVNENGSIADNERLVASQPKEIKNGNLRKPTDNDFDPDVGPSVEHALSMSPTEAQTIQEPRKALIGSKKPASSAKKKGGFGAQKVKTNFNEIENRANQIDKEREEFIANVAQQEIYTKDEEEKNVAQMRLAYKDMSMDRKKQEDKLKTTDPKKAEQLERLGMGAGIGFGNREISHSAVSDMKVIDQQTPNKSSSYDRFSSDRPSDRYSDRSRKNNYFEDELDSMFSGPPKYKDSPFSSKNDDYGRMGSSKSTWDSKESSWDSGFGNKGTSWDSDRFDNKQSEVISAPNKDKDRSGRIRKTTDYTPGDDAQKKFASAKSISSDQYFGGKDVDFETNQKLSSYQGSQSISSADLFGNGQPKRESSFSSPDIQDIKDGVRQGVTKVAGKLSNIASGVMTSLQQR